MWREFSSQIAWPGFKEIGNYGLVHYEAVGATVVCEAGFRAGEEDQDRFYITLFA
jgi:hypothetical protein